MSAENFGLGEINPESSCELKNIEMGRTRGDAIVRTTISKSGSMYNLKVYCRAAKVASSHEVLLYGYDFIF